MAIKKNKSNAMKKGMEGTPTKKKKKDPMA